MEQRRQAWSLLRPAVSPCSAELPLPCCAFLRAALAHDDPFRSDFSLKAGMPSGKRGRCPNLSESTATHILLQQLGSLHRVWRIFFFSKTPEKASSFEIYPVHEDARVFLHSYFQHLT